MIIKRLFDMLFSFVLILIFLPIIFLVAIYVKVFIGSPVFFLQRRPGLHSKPFTLIKFKTMIDQNETNPIPDSMRIIKPGMLLRSSSLDELPSLFNVLKGDMSLVGPRPLLMEYIPLFNDYQKMRHNVRPGITGWAQINGRNAITWEERFDLDIWYVNNRSFLLDTKILFLTVIKVISRENISAPGHVTKDRFKGNE